MPDLRFREYSNSSKIRTTLPAGPMCLKIIPDEQ